VKKKILGFIQSPAFIITMPLLLIILIIHFVVLKNDFSQYPANLNTELLSIIITVVFVQYLFGRQKYKQEKKKELDQILRDDGILEIYLTRYKNCFNAILTCTDIKRDFADAFEYKDLANLFRSSKSIKARSAIESFYETQKILIHHIQTLVSQNDYEFYDFLKDIFVRFIETRVALDASKTILGKIDTQDDERMLAKSTQQIYEDNKENPTSPHYPYICLYDLLKLEQELILEYEQKIHVLKTKNR